MARTWKDPAGGATPARAGNFGKLECADLTTATHLSETLALRRLDAEGGAQ